MKKKTYTFKAKVWIYPTETAAWHFISLERKDSLEIKENYKRNLRGFGSIPVRVTIGKTTWETSIFPESRSGVYMLPIKAEVRRKEDIFDGDDVRFILEIR